MARDRLLADIMSVSPSALDNWHRCPRLYLNANLLGLPDSDGGGSPDFGQLVHGMLERIHRDGTCRDQAYVDDVLAGHGLEADSEVAAMVARHVERCPSPAARQGHELEVARFHRAPAPMFMAVGRLDAVWERDGLLEIRDYKTGRRTVDRLVDDQRARLQAWLAAPIAFRLGLRIRVRYEHLAAEVSEDPEPFEPEPEDLDAIGEEVRASAAAIAAAVANGIFKGVSDRDVCRSCRYRSVCPDSATPGVPSWPTPPGPDEPDADT